MQEKEVKKKTGRLSGIIVLAVALFAGNVLLLIILQSGILKELTPVTSTSFQSYGAFYEKVSDYYPAELPDSASEPSYYYYSGHFDDKSAVAFWVNESDLADLKEHYTDYFSDFTFVDKKQIDVPLTEDFTENEGIQFLDTFLEEDIRDYRIVAYIRTSDSKQNTMMGMLSNDAIGKIILFDCVDTYQAP